MRDVLIGRPGRRGFQCSASQTNLITGSFTSTDLVERLSSPERAASIYAPPAQFSISGPEVRLAPDAADLMSLVIHELATNAVKYGALSQSRAKISVAWTVVHRFGRQILQFEWVEAEVQIMARAPPTPGFGSQLIQRLIARELKGDGKMTFLADGVRCAIAIPIENGAAAP